MRVHSGASQLPLSRPLSAIAIKIIGRNHRSVELFTWRNNSKSWKNVVREFVCRPQQQPFQDLLEMSYRPHSYETCSRIARYARFFTTKENITLLNHQIKLRIFCWIDWSRPSRLVATTYSGYSCSISYNKTIREISSINGEEITKALVESYLHR